ncbi:MAG: hypothetical protein LBS96_06260 [Oscillospiraceae bacterium]|jgi:hypothetical protein|nr:hypothetical protein [Oscillospiraceae bacterium]
MTEREIFHAAMLGGGGAPRLPRIEWAAWWDKTIARWEGEGFPKLGWEESQRHFGLDIMRCLWVATDAPHIADEADYERVRDHIFTQERIASAVAHAQSLQAGHARGDFTLRLAVDGFFWFPRRLFGIEPHMYAFYDSPELMHRINSDLLAFHLRLLDQLFAVVTPDLFNLAEDMSYNHGPMLSQACFEEFLRPYYLPIAEKLKAHGVPFFVDTDGLVDQLVPWLLETGVEGFLPLERQSGVDVNALRAKYPQLLMLGGYDKMVMHQGEAAMRAEFERLLPLMRSGGFVASVDHQTPPGVSFADYQLYIQLLHEYTEL